MCGITGYISFDQNIQPADLRTATSLLEHRGPDAEGFYFSRDKKVGLGHRRLSILDLSESANQPMYSSDGRHIMVYNGEVYNFKELKQQLQDKGRSLKTTSDTEVILELFTQKGVACFRNLNGMFAFAIYDTLTGIVTLCRDHAGVKPLFVYHTETEIIFSSEIKSIRCIKGNELTINKKAIPYFLHLGFIPHPLTIFNNLEKFPAAHYVQIATAGRQHNYGTDRVIPYWNISDGNRKPELDEGAVKKNLNKLLLDSVQQQLVSDVPIGTFLSGGVDSSLVTAIAASVSNNKINTYNIAIDDGRYNESKYATQVARHLQTDHHEFSVKEKEVMELLGELLPAYDEPFADSSALPTMMVSRLARNHVTVALSGDGGDELFLGYGAYNWAKTLDKKWLTGFRKPIYAASKLMNDKYRRAGELFGYKSQDHLNTHIFSQEQYFFSEGELDSLLIQSGFNFDSINTTRNSSQHSAMEKQALWDFNYYLPDDLLVKIDRASMRFSLETRVPLLDYRIIEFAHTIDPSIKIKGGELKYLLKQVLYDYVPSEIFNRPKWGFSIPLKRWLKTDLSWLVEKYTSKEIIEKYQLLHFSEVQKIKNLYARGFDYFFNRVWVIIVLHWWLEENNKPIPSMNMNSGK
ncbi:MAG: asparagine synthase (glutamine-hydrolyzing) [Ginsengibacter sp.]